MDIGSVCILNSAPANVIFIWDAMPRMFLSAIGNTDELIRLKRSTIIIIWGDCAGPRLYLKMLSVSNEVFFNKTNKKFFTFRVDHIVISHNRTI